MYEPGKQEPLTQDDLSTLYHEPAAKGPVFPGTPHTQTPYQPGNLAVKKGLMDIFDEFTEIISGELKTMQQEEAGRTFKTGNTTPQDPPQGYPKQGYPTPQQPPQTP